MTLPVFRSPASVEDVTQVVRFLIDQDAPKTARRFAAETIGLISQFPKIGSPWRGGRAFRRFLKVRRFRNYLIFYRRGREGIVIDRILYGWQDLGRRI